MKHGAKPCHYCVLLLLTLLLTSLFRIFSLVAFRWVDAHAPLVGVPGSGPSGGRMRRTNPLLGSRYPAPGAIRFGRGFATSRPPPGAALLVRGPDRCLFGYSPGSSMRDAYAGGRCSLLEAAEDGLELGLDGLLLLRQFLGTGLRRVRPETEHLTRGAGEEHLDGLPD